MDERTLIENNAARAIVHFFEDDSPGSAGHAARVSSWAVGIGYELGLRGENLVSLRLAAEIHNAHVFIENPNSPQPVEISTALADIRKSAVIMVCDGSLGSKIVQGCCKLDNLCRDDYEVDEAISEAFADQNLCDAALIVKEMMQPYFESR